MQGRTPPRSAPPSKARATSRRLNSSSSSAPFILLGTVVCLAAIAQFFSVVVSAYRPGWSVPAITTGGTDTLHAHDVLASTGQSAVLGSSASSDAPCIGLKAVPNGPVQYCGGVDLVVSILDKFGNNAKQFRLGTNGNDVGLGIAWSRYNNRLHILGKANGQHWIAVVDPSGRLIVQKFVGPVDPTGQRFALTQLQMDASGNVFIGGHTALAKPPNGCARRAAWRVDLDILVCKLNTALTYNWCQQVGGGFRDTMVATGGTGIAFDGHGNVFIAGNTNAFIAPNKPLGGGADGIVAKLDANGNILWVKQYGTSSVDVAVSVGVDTYADIVYLAGNTAGGVPDDYQRGGGDWFLFQLRSADGSRVWSRNYGGPGQDILTDIAIFHQRVFFVGTMPNSAGIWTGLWNNSRQGPDDGDNIYPNSGMRIYYNYDMRGGRDVQVCEIANTGPETGVRTDWTLIPDGMIKWCSIYGSAGDDGTASLRIYGYNMSFPWTSNGDFDGNGGTTVASVGGRDVGSSMYWEYDLPPFSATEKLWKDPVKAPLRCF